MKPERILTVEASDSLNFLLYIHNYAKQEKQLRITGNHLQ